MTELYSALSNIDIGADRDKAAVVAEIDGHLQAAGYTVVETNGDKPWGAYLRLDNNDADSFVAELFVGLSPEDARLGKAGAELSPKILLVAPNQRLSWQYHNRRAERWTFLTDGAYNKSSTDEQGEVHQARAGDVVQFAAQERHRLVGRTAFTLVAEIWQHSDPDAPSNEDDIIRLADDYAR